MKKNYEEAIKIASQIPATYCPVPFTDMYSASDGHYKLCCHATRSPGLKSLNDKKALPFEYFFSEEMDDIRDNMMQGKDIPECAKCHDLEKSCKMSPRLNWLLIDGLKSTVEKISINLRINGSYCNLGCYMCGPTNSSTRRKILNEIYDKDDDMRKYFYFDNFTFKHTHWNKVVSNILENIHLVDRIHMTGGEPLQLPKYWEFLDSIPDDIAKNIVLSHTTNLTKIRYKNHSIHDIINKFKEVHYAVSCDHFGDKLAWIRNPIDVQEFENNLKELCETDTPIRLQVTTGILNIDDHFEIRDYYKDKFNIETSLDDIDASFEQSVVSKPELLSIRNLPQKLKDVYIEKYQQYPTIVSELKKESLGLFEESLKYCDDLSAHMGKDFRILWKDWLEKVKSYE